MLEYTTRRIKTVTIVDLDGSISMGEGFAFGPGSEVKISDLVRQLLRDKHTSILLDLTDVTYIDSSGIGDLFSALCSVERQGGQLKILTPSKVVRHALDATRLSGLIEIKDDEQDAIRSFRPPLATAG